MNRSWTDRIKDRLEERRFSPKPSDRDALSKLLDEQFPMAQTAATSQSPKTSAAWTQGAWIAGLSAALMLLIPSDRVEIVDQRVNAPVGTEIRPEAQTELPGQNEPQSETSDAAAAALPWSDPFHSNNIETELTPDALNIRSNSTTSSSRLKQKTEDPGLPTNQKALNSVAAGARDISAETLAHIEEEDPNSAGSLGMSGKFARESQPEPGFRGIALQALELNLMEPKAFRPIEKPLDGDLRRKPQGLWGPDALWLSVGPGVSTGWEAQALLAWERAGFRWGTGLGTGQSGAMQKRLESSSYWEVESRQEWQTSTQYVPSIDSTWRILGINQGAWQIDTNYTAVVDSNWVTVLDSTERMAMLNKSYQRSGQLLEWPLYAERTWASGRWEFSSGLGVGLGVLRFDAEGEMELEARDVFRSSLELRMGVDWRWNEHGSLGLGYTPRYIWYAEPDFEPYTDLRALRLRVSWRW